MKIRKLKLEAALLLAAVMACSAPASTGTLTLTASAATGTQVKLNVKSKTLKAGQKDYKLKLVNNKQKWKIKKATSTKASVCKPYGRKNTYVLLKGQKKGDATIRVKIARTVTKNGKKATKSKWLSCKVRVKKAAAETAPDKTESVNGDATATDQAQLEAALKNPGTKTLRLQTEAADTFTIPKADYKDIELTVDAPNADVVNNGTFKSISVLAIKDSTWFENAVGNLLNVFAKSSRIVVQQGASVNDISFASPDAQAKVSIAQGSFVKNIFVPQDAQRAKMDVDVSGSVENIQLAAPDADVKMAVAENGAVNKVSMDDTAGSAKVGLDVKGTVSNVLLDAPNADVSFAVNDNGKVDGVTVSKEMNVAVSGTAKSAVALKVSAAAKITAFTGIALESSANVSIVLEKGAEGSSIKITGNLATIEVNVENKTGQGISVNTPNGNYTVSEGSSKDITVDAPSSSGNSSSSGGSSSGGSSFGGSSSGGSSSGGSSSGGSSSGDQTTPPTGIMLDHTDFTMKLGQEDTLCVSTNPKGAGRLENILWDGGHDTVTITPSFDWETRDTLKLKANAVGITYITVSADVYGTEKNSALLLPNQSKTIVVTVTEDGNAPESAAKIKLTPMAASIDVGETTAVTAEIESPQDATIYVTEWRYSSAALDPVDSGLPWEFQVRGRAKGKGTVTAIVTVNLADGTQTKVAQTVEIEVTDKNAPDPEGVSPYYWLNAQSVTPIEVGKKCHLSLQYDSSRYYGLKITKVEWTLSDESILRIDEKRLSEIDFTSLKAGECTLTADITFTTGPKTFTKQVSEKILVRNLPKIACSASVTSGAALNSLELKANFTATADGANVPIQSFERSSVGLNAPQWPSNVELREDTFVLTDATVLNYDNLPITIHLESGENITAKLKITITKDSSGAYSAVMECTDIEWTFDFA